MRLESAAGTPFRALQFAIQRGISRPRGGELPRSDRAPEGAAAHAIQGQRIAIWQQNGPRESRRVGWRPQMLLKVCARVSLIKCFHPRSPVCAVPLLCFHIMCLLSLLKLMHFLPPQRLHRKVKSKWCRDSILLDMWLYRGTHQTPPHAVPAKYYLIKGADAPTDTVGPGSCRVQRSKTKFVWAAAEGFSTVAPA